MQIDAETGIIAFAIVISIILVLEHFFEELHEVIDVLTSFLRMLGVLHNTTSLTISPLKTNLPVVDARYYLQRHDYCY